MLWACSLHQSASAINPMSSVAIVRVQCGALDGGDDSHPEYVQAGTAIQGDNGLEPHCHEHLGEPKCVI